MRSTCWTLFIPLLLQVGCASTGQKAWSLDDKLRREAIDQLWLNLHTQSKLEKVHVAEFIWWLGLDSAGAIYPVFLEEEKKHFAESPYRIPVWRVLVRTEKDPARKKEWIGKLFSVYGDSTAPDRVHTAESLAKLSISPVQAHPELVQQTLAGKHDPFYALTFWAVSTAITDADAVRANRRSLVQSFNNEDNDLIRAYAAYSLRHLGGLTGDEWHRLANSIVDDPLVDSLHVYAISAGIVTAPADSLTSSLYGKMYAALLAKANSPRKDDRMEVGAALARRGTPQEVDLLVALLRTSSPLLKASGYNLIDSPANADVRSVAAYALLSMDQANKQAGR